MTNEIRGMVIRYAAGDLSDPECEQLELLALNDPEVAALLDKTLQPTADALRAIYPAIEIDPAIKDRLVSSTSPKLKSSSWLTLAAWRSWALVGAAVCSAGAALFLLNRSSLFVKRESTGINGIESTLNFMVSADPAGQRVLVAAGGVPYREGRCLISSDVGYANVAVRSDSEGRFLDLLSGALVVMSPVSMRVKAGPLVATCSGGQFSIDFFGLQPIRISAYRGTVHWRSGAKGGTVAEGRWTEGGRHGFIEDDPLQTNQLPPPLVCPSALDRISEMAESPAVRVEHDLSPDQELVLHRQLNEINVDPNNPTPYEALAMMYAKARLRRHAGYVLERAVTLDPSLRGFPDLSDVRYLMRAVGQPGDRQELDMPDLADAIARVLDSRDSENKSYYDSFAAMVKADAASTYDNDESCTALADAALSVEKVGRPEDLLPVGEALFRSGMHIADVRDDFSRVHHAAAIFGSYTKLPGLSRRELAEGYERLGEALFWDPLRHAESRDMTAKAVALWPRPHWLVHSAAREVEAGVASHRSFEMLKLGLATDPSPDSYIRALAFMGVPARNQAEFDRKYDLAEWIGLAYNNVAEAVQVAGDNLYPGRPAKARALLQRYRQLEGDDRMANDERALLAILDWTAERDSGQDPDDVTIARNEGLVSRSFVNPKAHWFFAQVGDFRRAVGALQHKSRNDDLLEGMYCDRMGDKARAIAAYQRYLHQRWTVNDSEGVAEARVGIAELTGPDAAKKLIANDGWEQGINLVTYQGLRFCPPRPFYLARLVWAAGDRDEALVMMKKFVQETAGNGPARYASAILASWEAETARRKKQTIHR